MALDRDVTVLITDEQGHQVEARMWMTHAEALARMNHHLHVREKPKDGPRPPGPIDPPRTFGHGGVA